MKLNRHTMAAASAAFTILLSAAAPAAGQTIRAISIDFVGGGAPMAAAETAGVVPLSNWNSAAGARTTAPLSLQDASGAPTTATVVWSADGTWRLPIADSVGSVRMMRGYLDNTAQRSTIVTVAGLPTASYDVYVYADGDNGRAVRTATYQLSGAGFTTRSTRLTDAGYRNFSGSFTLANNSSGNYVRFTVTASGFTLTAIPGSATDYRRRAPVNGIQIVPAGIAPTYGASGTVTPTSLGVGTTLTLTGTASGTTGTTAAGAYAFSGLANGSYTITPSRPGYRFTPSARSFLISGANVSGLNFSASRLTYSISGTIDSLAGATVTLSGAAGATTTTNTNGAYTFAGLAGGTYVVTPSLGGYVFAPSSTTVVVAGASVIGVNFTPSAVSDVIFFDDFSGSAVDGGVWTVMNRPGDPSNDEPQCYRPDNVAVADGRLAITARAESIDCNGAPRAYTSGMVQWTNFSFLYGTVEIRARMADGQGPWSALWLLGTNCQQQNIDFDPNGPCNWPVTGSDEIDIADHLYASRTQVVQAIHSNATNFWCTASATDVTTNWHTYRLAWSPGLAVWSIDGVDTCRTTSGVPSTPMFLLLNVAMDGTGGGPIVDSTLPQTLFVDYVKVTRR